MSQNIRVEPLTGTRTVQVFAQGDGVNVSLWRESRMVAPSAAAHVDGPALRDALIELFPLRDEPEAAAGLPEPDFAEPTAEELEAKQADYERTTRPRYAVGDRVVIQPEPRWPDGAPRLASSIIQRAGQVGKVKYVRKNAVHVVVQGRLIILHPDSVAPYTEPPAPRFKRGDWVRATIEGSEVFNGLTGTVLGEASVMARRDPDTPNWEVLLTEQPEEFESFRESGAHIFRDDELEPYNDRKPGEFRVGDRVRIKPGVVFEGRVGTVIRVHDPFSERWPIEVALNNEVAGIGYHAHEVELIS